MSHIKSLLALMQFNTSGLKYNSRLIQPRREELELVIDGQAIFEHNGDKISVSPGHLLWHKPGDRTIRSNLHSQDYECLLMAFEVNDDIPRYRPHLSIWDGIISARHFAEDALKTFSNCDDDDAFCQYLYNSCVVHSSPLNSIDHPLKFEEHCVNKAIQFIAENFSKHIEIEHIANAAHVSSSSLHYFIKEYTGLTPHQLLLKYRMEQALKLVAQKKPLKEISIECGFESESGFVRAFKKCYGVTPKKFRQPAEAKTKKYLPESLYVMSN